MSLCLPSISSAQVSTWVGETEVNWTRGVVRGIGVGKSSYSSSIARPSRSPLFEAARRNAEVALLATVRRLWAESPLYTAERSQTLTVAQQALIAFPPRVELYSDGSVHAVFEVPLGAIEGVTRHAQEGGGGESAVIHINGDYRPMLGTLFCLNDEVQRVAQARITIHKAQRELPTFLRSNSVTELSGTFDAEFQCIRLKPSPSIGDAWRHIGSVPRLYLVLGRGDDAL